MKFLIGITADLTNIKTLQPQLGCDDTNFSYFFKMKCVDCRQVTTKDTCVRLSEKVEDYDGSVFNLTQKCVYCRKKGFLKLIPGHGRPLLLATAESRMYTPLMMIEYRGYMEPVDFSFGPGWKAVSVSFSGFVLKILWS
ncbi:hypothetical protein AQUCO_02000289v1 [Aquilegia coerulea]|uniref:Uncharacterized protein n=1 Tax=Aquilegia coerulea TaxID=218851 RepID=A0A2G5DGU1_AQUCA|nr:hypothetical protein AQUCO_02000289v1 [Aquilegia coerulea]